MNENEKVENLTKASGAADLCIAIMKDETVPSSCRLQVKKTYDEYIKSLHINTK